jgi:methyl-accepting chemotaxis protein
MQERRRVRRTQTYKCAKISLNGSLRDCVVRNISSLGARLALVSTAYIPDEIFLTFDNARTLRTCRVAWRSTTEIGVEFCETSFRPAA